MAEKEEMSFDILFEDERSPQRRKLDHGLSSPCKPKDIEQESISDSSEDSNDTMIIDQQEELRSWNIRKAKLFEKSDGLALRGEERRSSFDKSPRDITCNFTQVGFFSKQVDLMMRKEMHESKGAAEVTNEIKSGSNQAL